MRAALLSVCLGSFAAAMQSVLQWQPLYEPGVGGDVTAMAVDPTNSSRVIAVGDMLGLAVSFNAGGAGGWGSMLWSQPNASGFLSYEMAEITFSPAGSRIYVAACSGVYYSDYDDGVNWHSIRTGLPNASGSSYAAAMQKVVVDPQNPAHLLVFGGNKRGWGRTDNMGVVWESLNYGESWSNKSVIANGGNIVTASWPASGMLYAAVDGHGVFVSNDAGSTWQNMSTGLPSNSIGYFVANPSNASVAYVGSCDGHGVYRTQDAGASWHAASIGLQNSSCYESLGIGTDNPNVLYAANGNSQGQMWRSDDGGDSWVTLGPPPSAQAYGLGFGASYLTVDPQNSSIVYAGTWVTIWASNDAGATWVDVSSSQPIPGDASVWRGRGFSGLVTEGFKWNPYNSSMAVLNAMDAGKIWTSTDASLTAWRRQSGLQEFGGGSDATFAADGSTVYAGTGQYGWPSYYSVEGVAKTTDGGATWSYCHNPNITGASQYQSYSLYTLPSNPDVLWAIYQDGQLYLTVDGCGNWTKVAAVNDTDLYTLAAPLSNLGVTDPAQATLYVSGQKGVWRYAPAAGSWQLIPGGPTAWQYSVNKIFISQADDSTIFATNGEWDQWHSALWKLNTSTDTWEQLLVDTLAYGWHDAPAPALKLEHGGGPGLVQAYAENINPYPEVCTAKGVFITIDGGKTWAPQNAGLPMLRVNVIRFSPDGTKLVAGLNGRGYFIADATLLLEEARQLCRDRC
jgi:hypothetical protein